MHLYTNPIFKYDVNKNISLSGLEIKHRDLSKKLRKMITKNTFSLKIVLKKSFK